MFQANKKEPLLCTHMFNGFFFTNTGPLALKRSHEYFAQCAPPDLVRNTRAATMAGERDGPIAPLTNSTFCVSLTRHASNRQPFDAFSTPRRP